MSNLSAVPPLGDPESDPYTGLPSTWSLSAKATFAEISAENPHIGASEQATIYEACTLIASADAMDEKVQAEGLTIKGSRGQSVSHPLLAESRMCRIGALAALRSLGLAKSQSAASAAGAALVSKRWHGPRATGSRSSR